MIGNFHPYMERQENFVTNTEYLLEPVSKYLLTQMLPQNRLVETTNFIVHNVDNHYIAQINK